MKKQRKENRPGLVSLLIDQDTRLIDRDLSWLQFNERVLAEALDEENPLLERLRFLAISSSNLDEFFMVRFASLRKKFLRLSKNRKVRKKEYLRIADIRREVLRSAAAFGRKQERIFQKLKEQLVSHKIVFNDRLESSHYVQNEAIFGLARDVFHDQVLPELLKEPSLLLARFQHLKNLQTAALFSDGTLVMLPIDLPSFLITSRSKKNYVFSLEGLLEKFLAESLEKKSSPLIFRLTRDADFSLDLENEDSELIPELVQRKVDSRDKRKVLRLQYLAGHNKLELVEKLQKFFRIPSEQSFSLKRSLSLRELSLLPEKLKEQSGVSTKLFYSELKQSLPYPFDQVAPNVFSELKKRDFFFHHPYDSFAYYINFIKAAVEDPKVESLQQTIYRIDALSEIAELLKAGAAKGKFVRALIEPRARFDESNNLALAKDLRSAGVNVVLVGGSLKMHAKLAIVQRREEGKLVSYSHLSTGNYNSQTARVYTDMAIITSGQAIGEEVLSFFEIMGKGKIPSISNSLLIAPSGLHKKLLKLIGAETRAAKAGKPAAIYAKVNALVDPKIINSLYQASQAGVKIDLNVRGACSLLPGVTGLSQNIKVSSVVGRFLEHSRIYYFRNEEQIYLSSADWMPRNFYSRLEIAFPVQDQRIFDYISQYVIPAYQNDSMKGRRLSPQGVWRRASSAGKQLHNVQKFFSDLAAKKYRKTPLDWQRP